MCQKDEQNQLINHHLRDKQMDTYEIIKQLLQLQ